jgi:hypothetical protein
MKRCICLVTVVLSACGEISDALDQTASISAPQPRTDTYSPERTPIALSNPDVETVRKALRKKLKDHPGSVRFDGIIAGTTKKGEVIVCGWVNGKNSSGAYTERQPFAGSLIRGTEPSYRLYYIASDDSERRLVRSICGELFQSV